MQSQEEGVSLQLSKQSLRMTTSLNRLSTKKSKLTQKPQHFNELLKNAKVRMSKTEVQKTTGHKNSNLKRNLQTVVMTTSLSQINPRWRWKSKQTLLFRRWNSELKWLKMGVPNQGKDFERQKLLWKTQVTWMTKLRFESGR